MCRDLLHSVARSGPISVSRLSRYQMGQIRYRRVGGSPMTWAVGVFYRPDLPNLPTSPNG